MGKDFEVAGMKVSLPESVSPLAQEAQDFFHEHKTLAIAGGTIAALGVAAIAARTPLKALGEDALEAAANRANLVTHLSASVDESELVGKTVFTTERMGPGIFGADRVGHFEQFHIGDIKYPIGRMLNRVGIKAWSDFNPGYGSEPENTAFENFTEAMGKTFAKPINFIDTHMTDFLTRRYAERQTLALEAKRAQWAANWAKAAAEPREWVPVNLTRDTRFDD